MFTYDTFLHHYINDLASVDLNGRKKSKVPNFWNREPVFRSERGVSLSNTDDIYFISDTHFYHKNVIQYCNRPFDSTEEMEKVICNNYISVIKSTDIVIWCGDVTFGHIAQINELLQTLPGYKILILGNHDMDRTGKVNNLLFDEIHPCLLINREEIQLLVSHYPLDDVPLGCISIHGHIHHNKSPSINHVNVSVENINYTPININTVLPKTNERMPLVLYTSGISGNAQPNE